jgi:NADH dehydrogenase FAD-containing subunit
VTARGVKGKVLKGGRIQEFPADCVVVALGSEPAEFPVEELQKAGVQIRFIGDAKEVHGIAEAVRDGFVAGIAV